MTDSRANADSDAEPTGAKWKKAAPAETISESADVDPVARLAEVFMERVRRGERPSVKAYMQWHPEHAEQIGELFPMLLQREQESQGDGPSRGGTSAGAADPAGAGRRVGEFELIREIGRGGMGVVYEAQQVSLDRRVALKLLPPHVAGDQRLMTRFRREARAAARLHHGNIVPVYEVGQDGEVSYYAMQLIHGQSLDRVLCELRALRDQGGELGRSSPTTAAQRLARSLATMARTERSAASVANDSPTVAASQSSNASFDLRTGLEESDGTDGVAGDATLPSSPLLSSQRGSEATFQRRQYFRSVALLGTQVADALAHAHGKGILHRDIKPSNLLLDPDGRVWITDFGLAKTEEDGLTNSGDILGTLRYMPPERFEGTSDIRSDIYSMGITLYEMLALRPPFKTLDHASLIQQITAGEPPRLQTIDPAIPEDLETIVFKAIERDPQRRYKNATQLRLDLQRFLDDKPIAARRVSQREQLWRWCRRNPAVAGLAGALLLALLLGFVGVTVQWRRAEASAATARQLAGEAERSAQRAVQQAGLARLSSQREKAARLAAETARQRMRRLLYAAQMNLLPQAWEEANVARMRELLLPYIPSNGESDLRGFAWYYWWRRAHGFRKRFEREAPVLAAAFSPDGTSIVSAGGPRPLRQWNVTTGEVRDVLAGPARGVTAVQYDPSGRWLAAGDQQDVWLWDAETMRGGILPTGPSVPVNAIAFSPDGETLAAGCKDGTIHFWNTRDGAFKNKWADNPAAITALEWSPDGSTIAIACGDWNESRANNRVFLRSLTSDSIREFPSATGELTLAVALSSDGRWLATAGTNDVLLVDLRSGMSERLDLHTDIVSAVTFSPDSRSLVTGGSDRRIHFWDLELQTLNATLRGHGNGVRSLDFSADGTQLISGSQDQTVKLWDDFSPESPSFEAHDQAINALAVSPSGETFATAGVGGVVKLWDVEMAEQQAAVETSLGTVTGIAFAPTKQQVVVSGTGGSTSGDAPGAIELWDLESEQPIYRLEHSEARFTSVAISPDGRWLAAGTADGKLKTWNFADGSSSRTLSQDADAVLSVAFSPDGQWLVSAGTHQPLRVWNPETGRLEAELAGGAWSVRDIAFSGDGKVLASAGQDSDVRLWDFPERTLIGVLHGHAKVVATLAFSPDGKTLATGSGDQTVRLWDWSSGHQTGHLNGHALGVHALAFSEQGDMLLSADLSGQVRRWRAASNALVTEVEQ